MGEFLLRMVNINFNLDHVNKNRWMKEKRLCFPRCLSVHGGRGVPHLHPIISPTHNISTGPMPFLVVEVPQWLVPGPIQREVPQSQMGSTPVPDGGTPLWDTTVHRWGPPSQVRMGYSLVRGWYSPARLCYKTLGRRQYESCGFPQEYFLVFFYNFYFRHHCVPCSAHSLWHNPWQLSCSVQSSSTQWRRWVSVPRLVTACVRSATGGCVCLSTWGTPPGQDRVYLPPNRLCHERYASCGHVEGLSCFVWDICIAFHLNSEGRLTCDL